MSIEWISVLIVVGMLVLMAMGLPLAWSIGAVAVGLVFYQFDPSVMMMLVSRVFDMSMNYTLMSVPLFVLMAGLLQRSGVADQLFRVGDWIYRSTLTTLLGSILLSGAIEAAIVYAAIRFFIYDSPEFDERTDGTEEWHSSDSARRPAGPPSPTADRSSHATIVATSSTRP